MTEESITIINEKIEKKNKFTIVKHIESKNESVPLTPILSDSTKKNNFEWNFDTDSESDFKVNNSKTNLQYKQSSKLSINESECDDVFNESLPLNIESNNINYRELEGQDTITSLSNNIYLKQLNKIKKKASVKSRSSSQSIILEDIDQSNDNLKTTDNSSLSSKTNLKTLFNRGSFSSRKSLDLLNKQESNNLLTNKSILDLTESQDIINLLKQVSKDTSIIKTEDMDVNSSAQGQTSTKSEQMFQVLKDVIDNTNDTEQAKILIEKVMHELKLQEEKEKRKKDLQKKICFGLEIFVFITIFLLSILLVEKVILRLQVIYLSKLDSFNNNNNNNVTQDQIINGTNSNNV